MAVLGGCTSAAWHWDQHSLRDEKPGDDRALNIVLVVTPLQYSIKQTNQKHSSFAYMLGFPSCSRVAQLFQLPPPRATAHLRYTEIVQWLNERVAASRPQWDPEPVDTSDEAHTQAGRVETTSLLLVVAKGCPSNLSLPCLDQNCTGTG